MEIPPVKVLQEGKAALPKTLSHGAGDRRIAQNDGAPPLQLVFCIFFLLPFPLAR